MFFVAPFGTGVDANGMASELFRTDDPFLVPIDRIDPLLRIWGTQVTFAVN